MNQTEENIASAYSFVFISNKMNNVIRIINLTNILVVGSELLNKKIFSFKVGN